MPVMPVGPVPMSFRNGVIRPLEGDDIEPLKAVIEATDMFAPHLLDAMVAGDLSGGSPDLWLTVWTDAPIAVAFCAPEQLTEGTWNLLLIAVHPGHQGLGWGAALVRSVERRLRERGQRLLIVETSGQAEFQRTRDFYLRCGYSQEAVIRDFYRQGDDKVVFRKSLA